MVVGGFGFALGPIGGRAMANFFPTATEKAQAALLSEQLSQLKESHSRQLEQNALRREEMRQTFLNNIDLFEKRRLSDFEARDHGDQLRRWSAFPIAISDFISESQSRQTPLNIIVVTDARAIPFKQPSAPTNDQAAPDAQLVANDGQYLMRAAHAEIRDAVTQCRRHINTNLRPRVIFHDWTSSAISTTGDSLIPTLRRPLSSEPIVVIQLSTPTFRANSRVDIELFSWGWDADSSADYDVSRTISYNGLFNTSSASGLSGVLYSLISAITFRFNTAMSKGDDYSSLFQCLATMAALPLEISTDVMGVTRASTTHELIDEALTDTFARISEMSPLLAAAANAQAALAAFSAQDRERAARLLDTALCHFQGEAALTKHSDSGLEALIMSQRSAPGNDVLQRAISVIRGIRIPEFSPREDGKAGERVKPSLHDIARRGLARLG